MYVQQINQLVKLDFQKQLTFAYLTCERIFPNYKYFFEKFNFGNVDVLKESIDLIYNSIISKRDNDFKKIDILLNQVFENTPNTNDFTDYLATIAMYSGGVIFESLKLLKRADTSQSLNDISDMAIDAVDCYIQERDDMEYDSPGFEEKILNDPLMKREIEIQTGTISFLEKINTVDVLDIKTLLDLQDNNGRGNLDI